MVRLQWLKSLIGIGDHVGMSAQKRKKQVHTEHLSSLFCGRFGEAIKNFKGPGCASIPENVSTLANFDLTSKFQNMVPF